jgi:hypothetical protein
MKIGTLLFLVVVALGVMVCSVALIAAFSPNVKNKAGPHWLWSWGRYDPVRNIFFKQDGAFRRYGRLGWVTMHGAGLIFGLTVLVAIIWSIAGSSD